MSDTPLIEAVDVKKVFHVRTKSGKKELKAVNGVSFSISRGETLGLVGESGCGKSTIARLLLRLIEPTEGKVLLDGEDILSYKAAQMKQARKRMQLIFQNPYNSLNPRMTVYESVRAPLDVYHIGTEEEKRQRVLDIFNLVGLDESYLYRYPHEFSGGQRQRIVISRALMLNPDFVVCDEPVASLDMSVRAQVLNLLCHIQRELKVSYLFISHDLSVVRHVSDRIAVMYLGNVVELAEAEELYENPVHPYTQALLSAVLSLKTGEKKSRIVLTGDVPSPLDVPKGCCFCTRCRYATSQCRQEAPALTDIGTGHLTACHLYDQNRSERRRRENGK